MSIKRYNEFINEEESYIKRVIISLAAMLSLGLTRSQVNQVSARASGKDGKPDFYLMVKCRLGDRKMKFMIDESSATEYIPVNEIPRDKKYELVLKLYQDEEGLNRKEIRKLKDFDYPHVISYDMVPNDWKSIEFLKECNNLIKTIIGKI